jgi:hypothetical protein
MLWLAFFFNVGTRSGSVRFRGGKANVVGDEGEVESGEMLTEGAIVSAAEICTMVPIFSAPWMFSRRDTVISVS